MHVPHPDPLPCPLTSWDIELLGLLAGGASAAEASEHLRVPLRAIGQRLQTIRGMYGVNSTAAAIQLAIQQQHLPTKDP